MNPQTFQTEALAWIGVIVVVGGAVITAVTTLWTAVQTKLLKQAAENNKSRLDSHAKKIDDLLLNSQPSNAPSANTTNIVNAPDAQVTTASPDENDLPTATGTYPKDAIE